VHLVVKEGRTTSTRVLVWLRRRRQGAKTTTMMMTMMTWMSKLWTLTLKVSYGVTGKLVVVKALL
jgi:hypothetical protein